MNARPRVEWEWWCWGALVGSVCPEEFRGIRSVNRVMREAAGCTRPPILVGDSVQFKEEGPSSEAPAGEPITIPFFTGNPG